MPFAAPSRLPVPRHPGLAGASAPAASPQVGNDALTAAVDQRVGGIRTLLLAKAPDAAQGPATIERYARQLAARRPMPPDAKAGPTADVPGNAAYERWLSSEYDEAVAASAGALRGAGKTAEDAQALYKTARRADLGTIGTKSMLSNALGYGAVSLVGLAASIGVVTFGIAPLAALALSLGIAVGGTVIHAVHALKAGGTLNASFDKLERAGGGQRPRFTKALDTTRMGRAAGIELAADVPRTWLRLLLTGPLRLAQTLAGVLGASGPFLAWAGPAIAGFAGAIAPPTNGLMQMASDSLRAHFNGVSAGALFGVSVDLEGAGQPIAFDAHALARNQERLAAPTATRAWRTVCRLLGHYRHNFGAEYGKERAIGMTPEKRRELFFGGNTLGPVATAAGGLAVTGGAIAGPVSGAFTKLLSTLAGGCAAVFNIFTRGPVVNAIQCGVHGKSHGDGRTCEPLPQDAPQATAAAAMPGSSVESAVPASFVPLTATANAATLARGMHWRDMATPSAAPQPMDFRNVTARAANEAGRRPLSHERVAAAARG